MTVFWCSSCKTSHAGDCPPAPTSVPTDPVWGINLEGDQIKVFDGLIDAYSELSIEQLKRHYWAAKEALVRKLKR